MNSTPQAATLLARMSRTTGSNMIVRPAAGRFNEMDGTSPPTTLSRTDGWISRLTWLMHAVPSAYLRFNITRELLEASHKTCGGIEAPAHSTRVWTRPPHWRAQRHEPLAYLDQAMDRHCQLDRTGSSELLFSLW
jgi:hypothetical protein